MRDKRRKQEREMSQDKNMFFELATAKCNSLLDLWNKMYLRSVAYFIELERRFWSLIS